MPRTVNIHNARSKAYAAILRRITKDKVCPFCEKHFLKYHIRPILKTGTYWLLTENFHPYSGAKHHLLAVSRTHVEHFEKLSPAAHAELFKLFGAEARKRGIRGGTIFMRFGETEYTGGSVNHLHAQLVSGVKRGKNTEPLVTPISNKKKP